MGKGNKNKKNKPEDEEEEEPRKKGNQRGKKKGNDDDDDDGEGKAKLKGAHSIEVRHILCEKFSKKEQALAKLSEGETSFSQVAEEFSEDKARQGGYLGWKTRSDLVAEFADVAFEIEPSDVDSPIIAEAKSEFGYHIIMVHSRK
jgi:NIMA-interacting peptidyl-prolyl cis-trans isomerase 4